MGQVNLNIPSGGFALLNKPNPKGEKCIYLRYYISKYIKRSTDIWVQISGIFALTTTERFRHAQRLRTHLVGTALAGLAHPYRFRESDTARCPLRT